MIPIGKLDVYLLRVFPDERKVGTPMKEKEIISNYIDYRYNGKMLGDMAEIFRTSILKNFHFPFL